MSIGNEERKTTIYVYVSGPLTTGRLTENVHAAVVIAEELRQDGYAVYLPHTNVLWDVVAPHDYDDCIHHDLLWLQRCDCMLRLGESKGADIEYGAAKAWGIPVFHEKAELDAWRDGGC